jgi:hypothetical protein
LLGLEGWYVGRHVRRDARGWKSGEQAVRRLWVAEVRSSISEPWCLALIETDAHRLAAFAARHRYATTYVGSLAFKAEVAGPFELEPDWSDPVTNSLRQLQLDMWSGEREISTGGVSYSVLVAEGAVRLFLSFVNPTSPSLVSLADSVHEVADLIASRDGSEAVRECLVTSASTLRNVRIRTVE